MKQLTSVRPTAETIDIRAAVGQHEETATRVHTAGAPGDKPNGLTDGACKSQNEQLAGFADECIGRWAQSDLS